MIFFTIKLKHLLENTIEFHIKYNLFIKELNIVISNIIPEPEPEPNNIILNPDDNMLKPNSVVMEYDVMHNIHNIKKYY